MKKLNPTLKNWVFCASLIAFGLFLFAFIFPWLKGGLDSSEEEVMFNILWIFPAIALFFKRNKILEILKPQARNIVLIGISFFVFIGFCFIIGTLVSLIESKTNSTKNKVLTLEEFQALKE